MTSNDDRASGYKRPGGLTDLSNEATRDISAALRALLADVFALYVKTKNFHWHMSGSHFRDYHLLLDEQSDQIFAMTDPRKSPKDRGNYAALHRGHRAIEENCRQ
jgi:ferritin-like protein